MNEEELNAIVDKMIADGSSDDEIRAKLTELRSQPASTSEPDKKEERVALTVADASAEDIAAISIDTDYWGKQDVKREDVKTGENKLHDEQIAKEEKIAKSVKTSGDTSEEVVATRKLPSVSGIDIKEYIGPMGNKVSSYNKDTMKSLNSAYTRYGFEIGSVPGEDKISVTSKKGDAETFDLTKDEGKKAMDEWMRSRSVDQYASFEKSLEGVAVTGTERKEISEANTGDFERAFSGSTGTAYDAEIELKERGLAGGIGSSLDETGTKTTADKAFEQAAFNLTKSKFIQELDLTEEEKKNYKLTNDDIGRIKFRAKKEIAYDNPKAKELAIDIMNGNSEQGLIAGRIANKASIWGTGKIGDFDQDVLEAIGKEKLESLSDSKKAALGEYQVIKGKHTAIQELFKASGEALKNYDAQGKIDAIKGREFKTQEEVDTAKSEIANIIAGHEKLSADYSGKLRNYDLITDAAVKASEKIGKLQVDIDDVGSYTQAVALDYGLLNRMGESLGNAAIDLVQGGVSAGELVLDVAKQGIVATGGPVMKGMLAAYENSGDDNPSAFEKAHAAVDAYQAEWSNSMYHMQYDDVDSASDFGEWFAVMMAGQVPNLALMATTGGASLYAMGITSTGQKYLDLKAQNKLYAESGGLYGNEYSFGEMFLNATVSGAAEALSEKITLGQVNAAKGVFKGMIKSKGVRAGVKDYLTKNVFSAKALRATGKDFLEEGGSEAVATISGNLMDIFSGNREAGFWDGVEESFVSGVMMSGALKSPTLANHAMSAFRSPDTDAIREANLTRINELSESLLNKDHELSSEAVDVIQTELAELTAETADMLERDIKIVDTLTDNDKKKLLGLESGKRKIQAQWESVKNDNTLSETEKEAIESRLKKKVMANNATKAEMLSQYTPEAADIKYSETTMPLKSPDQKLEENIEFAKKHSALYGLEVNDEMSVEQIREEYGDEGAESDGFLDPKTNRIIINKEVAADKKAVTVGSHELLHGILKKSMADGDLSTDVISQLKKEIGSQWSVVQERIDENYSPEYMEKNPDEYLTLVSDAIANGDITYEETTFDKLKEVFIPIFRKLGFKQIKFNTGKDVYSFLKEYNKSIHKGALATDIVKATQTEADANNIGIKPSMTSDQKKAAARNVKELGSKETNKSWRRGGADAAIKNIKDNGYFDALIASKYKVKPVPRDFVEKVYSEITPHIKRFKPEQNDNLFAYINSQIGNKAGNVYNSEYKVDEAMRGSKDIDAKTSEGAPVIQVAAETDADVTSFEEQDMSMQAQSKRTKLAEQGKSESDKYSGLRTELGLEKSMMDRVRNAVTKTFGTKLPDVNSKKFKAALQKAYRTELKKPIQDMIGKGATYDTFLTESFPTVFKFLPKETLLQMERNIDPAKRIFTKSERITKPTEVDKLINDGLLPKDTNRLSGPTLITKLPYPGSKKVMAYFRGKNMDNTLGYKVGASTLGTRKDKLAMEMGVELGFDATMETVQQPEVADRREGILGLTGQAQAENDVAVMAKQINRDPSIKFSKSSDKQVQSEYVRNYGTAKGEKIRAMYPDLANEVEDYAITSILQIDAGGYNSQVLNDKNTPESLKKFFETRGKKQVIYIGPRIFSINSDGKGVLNKTGENYANEVAKMASTIHPSVSNDMLLPILGIKDSGKYDGGTTFSTRSLHPLAIPKQVNEITGRELSESQIAAEEKLMEDNGIIAADLKLATPMVMKGEVAEMFAEVESQPTLKLKQEKWKEQKKRRDGMNRGNKALLKYIVLKLEQAAKQGELSDITQYHLGAMQTNIVEGLRALSTYEYQYLTEGKQYPIVSKRGGKFQILKRPTTLGRSTKDYLESKDWADYNKQWEDTVDYKEVYNQNLVSNKVKAYAKVNEVSIELAAQNVTIKELMPKNEHVGASATTNAEINVYVNSAGANMSINDIGNHHRSFFGPKFLMDKHLDAKVKIDGMLVDNKVSFEGDLRLTKFAGKRRNSIYHSSGVDVSQYVVENKDAIEEVRNKYIPEINNRVKAIEPMNKALKASRSSVKPKGITVLDFDDTLATTKSNVLYTMPDGTTGKLNAEEFAKKGGDLLAQGVKFDFSEFNKVVDGKTAPLFNKAMKLSGKFGTENMFILTARAPASQLAIKQFLDAQGLNIPLKNITGLGKSEASAKANWIAEKVGEGYNDFYFADDAMQNVKAVKDMLDQFDVKGKVQQARLKFSKSGPKKMADIISEGETDLSSDLNTILEQSKGVSREKVFSAAKARKRGKNKGKFKFFVPPSADDFAGLMYAFMGKGKQGEKHHQFFKENLFDPFSKGIRHLNVIKQTVANDMKELRKAMPEVRKKLDKTVPGTEYTHEDAIRVYNWAKAGFDIPGLSETDKQTLINAVENDASLNAFAQGVNSISNTPGGMVEPGNHWLGGNIALDLKEALDVARGTHLQQWKENKDILFTEANLNKIEAVYGSNFREALEDSLYRMEFGGNKSRGSGRLLNNFTNWIHGSIGTTMFLNARSAMLQMISNVNFVNWSDNNMVAAASAFANQKQYWSDVSMIFNSPFLKQRRSGIQTDVNAAELLAQIKDSKNQVKAATAYLLQLGFTPTQIADSFAIATGGATFYRNRIKTYLKEGMTQAEAETKAFEDMMEIAEETQQSTREDKISQQQASPLGKFILAFQNTPMQYNRLIKKASQDLVNGRGDPKANISRIVYYGGIQNLIFYGLQSALFAALFSDDEEDQLTDKKKERVMNGMVDTLLRGSGIGGAVVATVKNVIFRFIKEEEKEQDDNWLTQANHANTLIEALNISPPIGIKARKLYSASQTWDFNRDVIAHMSKTDIDNPVYDAMASATEAVTNIPLSRLYGKYQNISEALNADNEMWQRTAMLLGWNKWSFGIKNQNVVAAKGEVKEIKAAEAEERREMKKRAKETERQAEQEAVIEANLLDQDEERADGKEDIKCAAVSKSGNRCGKKVKGSGNYCTVHESAPSRRDGEKTQCSHVKSDGKRCKMKTPNQSGKCYYHD
jgi:hypothetical protein